MPAGIPLDRRGIRYGDQERADGGFEDFQSIEVEFECESGMCVFRFPSAPFFRSNFLPPVVGTFKDPLSIFLELVPKLLFHLLHHPYSSSLIKRHVSVLRW